MAISFWDIVMLNQIFLSQILKWSTIISYKYGTCVLAHKYKKNKTKGLRKIENLKKILNPHIILGQYSFFLPKSKVYFLWF